MTSLTKAQRRALMFAASLSSEYDGVSLRGGQRQMFEHLRARGLLGDAGYGENDRGREVPLYTITAAGRAAHKERSHDVR